jgi:hypothetical protein
LRAAIPFAQPGCKIVHPRGGPNFLALIAMRALERREYCDGQFGIRRQNRRASGGGREQAG